MLRATHTSPLRFFQSNDSALLSELEPHFDSPDFVASVHGLVGSVFRIRRPDSCCRFRKAAPSPSIVPPASARSLRRVLCKSSRIWLQVIVAVSQKFGRGTD